MHMSVPSASLKFALQIIYLVAVEKNKYDYTFLKMVARLFLAKTEKSLQSN